MTARDIAHGNTMDHKTPGEELYLIHLRRMREEEDDHDHLPRKRRSSSVGEELWEIHRRRSQGAEDDSDRDTDDNVPEKRGTKHDATTTQKKSDAAKCRYNLRSKDSPIKKS